MRIITSLAFALCLSGSVTVSASSSIATQLANYYLKSFDNEVEKTSSKTDQAKKEKASHTDITAIHLSPRTERNIVFNEIFAKSSYYEDQYKQGNNLLNPYVWNDLHLFCGTTTTPAYHLLSRINKTITVLGEAALASLIAAPTANLETLRKRQRFIDFLRQKTQLYLDLKSQLQNYKTSEKAMLSFWTATEPLYVKEYDKYLTGLFYTSSAASNKLASVLQVKKLWLRDVWNIYSSFIWYPLIIGPASIGLSYMFANSTDYSFKTLFRRSYPLFLPGYNIYHVSQLKNVDGQGAGGTISLYGIPVFITLHSFYQGYKGYCNYKEYAGVLKNLALRMADIQTFLMTVKKVNALVEQYPDVAALYAGQLEPIRTLLARINESSEVGDLLRFLEALPLRSWSYLGNNAGKLLASYKLFVEHKAVFHDAMYALGELDAFTSVATLMKETAAINGPHAYTFTKFLSPQSHTKPRLSLVEMWNPMLTPMQAVGNDVTMDRATQNIILTGPNAGGKSTFLTGVAITVILSQTFGIASAKSCEMTPFSKINTYIDVTDDIAAGKSLFMAEVDRFQSHLRLLEDLKQGKFSFTIFDEPFSGTNPVEGAAVLYSVLNYIAKYSNALNIVATHSPIVMLLEQREPQKGFKNYKVFIKSMGKDGKIQYTYKVVPGASNQTIAIDILAEQGYATEMLQQARDIISHPEKYKKSFAK